MGKEKVGPILGIVGSALVLIAGFISFGVQATVEAQLALGGLSWEDIGFDPSILMIRSIIVIVLALVGLIGAILALTGKRVGAFLLLIAGIVAVVGIFIPLGTITIGFISIPVPMTYSMFFVDPFIMLIGGILALVLKE
jgi:hypothetical protein